MKVIARSAVLVLLLGVIFSACYIAALAADEIPPAANRFAADDEMVLYSENTAMRANDYNTNRSVATSSSRARSYNIENAPALQLNNQAIVPQVEVEQEEIRAETEFTPAPNTGYESYLMHIAAGLALVCMSGVIARGQKSREY